VSNFDTTTHEASTYDRGTNRGARVYTPARRVSTETKASFKISAFVAYVVVAIVVLIPAALVAVRDFGVQEAWFYVTLLTVVNMLSRGLAKSGSRDFDNDEDNSNHDGR